MADTTDTTPAVISRYLAAADAQDANALAACFTPDGTVLDEGHTYRGHDEIAGWRRAVAAQWTFTSEIRSTEAVSPTEFLASVHVEGDFPGGQADLSYRFLLEADLISALTIVE